MMPASSALAMTAVFSLLPRTFRPAIAFSFPPTNAAFYPSTYCRSNAFLAAERYSSSSSSQRYVRSERRRTRTAQRDMTTTSASNSDACHDTGSSSLVGPLIDVDCNLLHPDLIALLTDKDGGEDSAATSDDDGGTSDEEHTNSLRILHHPSTIVSGIKAVLSPSSTIGESERSVDLVLSATGGRDAADADDSLTGGAAAQSAPACKVDIRTTAGVHPYHAAEVGPPTSQSLDRLRTILRTDRQRTPRPTAAVVAAVGETGLDYSDGFPSSSAQVPWFEAQLDLAFEFGLPLFVHERLAFDDTVRLIDEATDRHKKNAGGNDIDDTNESTDKNDPIVPAPPIIVHCFTGTFEQCAEYVRRGYHISMSGYVNKSGDGPDEVRRCLQEGIIPLDRLMIETDSPYMGFPSCRDAYFVGQGEAFDSLSGKKRKKLRKGIYPNVPSSLPLVLRGVVAALNDGREGRGGEPLEDGEVAAITTRNAIDFFGFSS